MSERPVSPPSFHQERAAAPVYIAPRKAAESAAMPAVKRIAPDRPTAGVTAFSGPRETVEAPQHIGPARNVLSVLFIVAMLMLFVAIAHDARSRYEAMPPLSVPPCVVASGHPCVLSTNDGEVVVSINYRGQVQASTAVPTPARVKVP